MTHNHALRGGVFPNPIRSGRPLLLRHVEEDDHSGMGRRILFQPGDHQVLLVTVRELRGSQTLLVHVSFIFRTYEEGVSIQMVRVSSINPHSALFRALFRAAPTPEPTQSLRPGHVEGFSPCRSHRGRHPFRSHQAAQGRNRTGRSCHKPTT